MSGDLTEKDSDLSQPSDFAGPVRAYLIVRRDDGPEVQELHDGGEAVLGRGEGSTFSIEDARVSRRHARVRWESGSLVVEDLGSVNGTVINGATLRGGTRTLRGGDLIRIGGAEIAVAIAAPPAIARAPDSTGRFDTSDRPSMPPEAPNGVIIADPGMARMFGFARRVAATTTTALILGETGVGKEVVAQQLHRWSDRADRRFIRVNCAALPESLVESELFGHERGAFTGADKRKVGFVEAANGGTLFLDEIGELSLPVQSKLLAMLENRAVVRVGSTVETPVDVRVISATHRALQEEVAAGRFREDLYYRISVVVIRVPPLRERPSEIMLLAKGFSERYGARVGWPSPTIAHDASSALVAHSWPGNIRELRNAIEHAMLLSEDGIVRREHLPETVTGAKSAPSPAAQVKSSRKAGGVREALAAVERASIEEALRGEGGNRTRAALALGISLRALLYKIRKYQITD
jgi:DNA-binding NtrC family response regulator